VDFIAKYWNDRKYYYKGVSWFSPRRKWRARIQIEDKDTRFCLQKDGVIINRLRGECPPCFRNYEDAETYLQEWLPQKEWLTIEQVQEAANISDEAALVCSINHHKQMLLAGWDKLQEAMNDGDVNQSATYCALCKRNYMTKDCPLKKNCIGGCIPEWKELARAKEDNFIEAQINMLNKLQETYNKLYGQTDNSSTYIVYLLDEFANTTNWDYDMYINYNKLFGEKKMKEIDVKLEQNKKDIERLEAEIEQLKAEKTKEEKYIFKAGDVCELPQGSKRLIVKFGSELWSINVNDGMAMAKGQKEFEHFCYKKIGELSDYLK